jgi:uncharacterized protein YndB with AHSA1/START domain
MSTPDVPHRFEFSVELPGTPAQVWQAIATSAGLTSWFMPTDVDERVGGEFTTHMGEVDAPGQISEWEPPHRLVVEEPGWAALAGHDGADVTPLVTEYLLETDSGGSCVLRVVSSAFGTGADWEREFFEDAQRYWMPMFDHLRVYLNHFPGQRASLVDTGAEVKGTPAAVIATMREQLGASAAGDRIELHGATGECSSDSPTARSASSRFTCSPRARAPPTPGCAGTCSATAPRPAPPSASGCGHSGSIVSQPWSSEL